MLKKVLFFCFASALCLFIQGAARGDILLSDFSNGQQVTIFGGNWYGVTDAANNGSSEALFTITNNPKRGANGSDYYGIFKGKVTTKFQYGFISVDCNFISNQSSYDLTKFKGIKFAVRGDGRTYKLQIRSPLSQDYCYYTHTFPTTKDWVVITLPFSSFKQETWGKYEPLEDSLKAAEGLQWQTIEQPIPSVEFELDSVYLY